MVALGESWNCPPSISENAAPSNVEDESEEEKVWEPVDVTAREGAIRTGRRVQSSSVAWSALVAMSWRETEVGECRRADHEVDAYFFYLSWSFIIACSPRVIVPNQF